MIAKVKNSWKRTLLIILRKNHINVQYHFVRDMVEDKKVLLEKVDTLENVANSLKKYVNTEKFSWCRESMGIDALNL